MPDIKKPEIIVFAGPNGSGKSTITQFAKVIEPYINAENGGHNVPEDKIRTRYERCLNLIPELVQVCDIFHLYDNTKEPFRIFKKRKTEDFFWENEFWPKEKIKELVKVVK